MLGSYLKELKKFFLWLNTNTWLFDMASWIIFFHVELMLSLFTSPKITHKFFALDKLTLTLRKSLTKPIVFLLFSSIFLFLIINRDLTVLNKMTSFYLPWNESIVLTSHFLFFPMWELIKATCWLYGEIMPISS